MPSAPQQSPQPLESTPLRREVEDQEYCSCGVDYTARGRGATVRMVQYLDRNESLKVEIQELEDCLD